MLVKNIPDSNTNSSIAKLPYFTFARKHKISQKKKETYKKGSAFGFIFLFWQAFWQVN